MHFIEREEVPPHPDWWIGLVMGTSTIVNRRYQCFISLVFQNLYTDIYNGKQCRLTAPVLSTLLESTCWMF